MRTFSVLALASLVALTATTAAVASGHGKSRYAARHGKRGHAARVVVSTRKVPGLGRILVDSKGLTLYMFVPDKRKKVTCVGVCAQIWPPLKAKKHAKLVARHGVRKKLLGTDKNPAGGRVVTYRKWPLYTYVTDRKPGQVTGQAVNSAGGLWYVLSPKGKVIKKKVH